MRHATLMIGALSFLAACGRSTEQTRPGGGEVCHAIAAVVLAGLSGPVPA